MEATKLRQYIFDQDYCISQYYTVCAKNPIEALERLKLYFRIKGKKDHKKGEDYYNYHKWKSATIYDLPDNYRIEERDLLQVLHHERI